jgi:uncharacterized protein (DUF4415 family)
MSKQEIKIHIPDDAEEAAINAGIAADSDSPEVSSEMIASMRSFRGPQKSPTKERITIRLSPDVLEAYRATGKGWQSRIDDDLKALIHKDKAA